MRNAVISTLGKICLFMNYGTFWQHYCLRRVLSGFGFAVSRYSTQERGYSPMDLLTDGLKNCMRIPWWHFRKFEGYQYECDNLFPMAKIRRKFVREYKSLIGNFEEENHFDAKTVLVVGSDQVLQDNPRPWFAFAPDSCRRIVYAGSTDWSYQKDNETWREIARRELPKFSAVGVRETAGMALCSSCVSPGVDVVKVVDPVMLLTREEWDRLANARALFSRPTLFCYFVNIATRAQLHVEVLEELASRLNCDLRILGIQGAAGWIPRKYLLALSPTEFLSAYRDARYVLTNSFHGSVFALIYNRDFLSMRQDCEKGMNQNLRQKELMDMFSLQQRHLSAFDIDQMYRVMSQRIDYGGVLSVLNSQRESSLNWLRTAMGCV